jgi:hypothetical protein
MHQQVLDRPAIFQPHLGVDDPLDSGFHVPLPHNGKSAGATASGMSDPYPTLVTKTFACRDPAREDFGDV